MNEEAQRAYMNRIQSPTELRPLTVKEAELLGNIMNTEPMVRAFVCILWQSKQIPLEFINVDFSDPKGAHAASRAQGQMQGIVNTIEALLQMTEAPTDEESGDKENE